MRCIAYDASEGTKMHHMRVKFSKTEMIKEIGFQGSNLN